MGPRTVTALVLGMTLGSLGLNLAPVLVEDWTTRTGLSGSSAGVVAAAQLLVTAVVTMLLSGRAARPGRARLARAGLPAAVVGAVGGWLADGPVWAVASAVVLGAGLGAVYAAATAAIAAAPDPDRASSTAVVGTVAVSAALITGFPLLGDLVDPGTGYLVVALLCLACWPLVGALPDGASSVPGSSVPGSAVVDRPRRPGVVLLAGTALSWLVTQGAWSYGAVLGRQHTGLDLATVSAVLAGSSVLALAGAAAGPALARRLGRRTSMAGLVLVQAVSVALVVSVGDPWVFGVAAVLWQAGQLAVLVQTLAAAAALDPTGRQVAALSGVAALGTAVGPFVVGMVVDSLPAAVLGGLLAAGTVISSVPLIALAARAGVVAKQLNV
jgi:predicted MFS family arabinose efflux permease